jgi:DNA-binding NtrC family response regulator
MRSMSYAVLICDDNPADRTVLRESLRDFEVVEVASENAARDALEGRVFDVIVASAIDVLLFVRSAYPATIRFLVSSQELETVVKAVNEGAAHRFFQKPCDADKLRDALAVALEVRMPAQGAT